ncbi:hypothetical protein GGS24DRAFT_357075 [Hypoxylon argillaceum]|nr:hypothetical protein GGS24DRAFT_357075 [Hypoxylon argillaceum]
MALDHEMNHEDLDPEDVQLFTRHEMLLEDDIKNGESKRVTNNLEHRLADNRRRLDKIVKEGFEAFDDCIRDSPNVFPFGLHSQSQVSSGSPYYMSGALQINQVPFVLESVEDWSTAPSPSDHRSTGISTLSSLSNSPDKMSSGGETSVQYNPQTPSYQAQPNSSQRETPVPPLEPWVQLGIPNPFGVGIPRTPTVQSQSRPLDTPGTPRMEEKMSSPSNPQVNESQAPESSPITRHLNSKKRKRRRYKNKKNKRH